MELAPKLDLQLDTERKRQIEGRQQEASDYRAERQGRGGADQSCGHMKKLFRTSFRHIGSLVWDPAGS